MKTKPCKYCNGTGKTQGKKNPTYGEARRIGLGITAIEKVNACCTKCRGTGKRK